MTTRSEVETVAVKELRGGWRRATPPPVEGESPHGGRPMTMRECMDAEDTPSTEQTR